MDSPDTQRRFSIFGVNKVLDVDDAIFTSPQMKREATFAENNRVTTNFPNEDLLEESKSEIKCGDNIVAESPKESSEGIMPQFMLGELFHEDIVQTPKSKSSKK